MKENLLKVIFRLGCGTAQKRKENGFLSQPSLLSKL